MQCATRMFKSSSLGDWRCITCTDRVLESVLMGTYYNRRDFCIKCSFLLKGLAPNSLNDFFEENGLTILGVLIDAVTGESSDVACKVCTALGYV